MLKEYLKPELIEDSKIKMILEQHADKILNIINQDVITYEDFKRLVKNIFNNSESNPNEGSFSYERELQKLYDEYRLFKRFVNNKERAQKVIKALWELCNKKSSVVEENLK